MGKTNKRKLMALGVISSVLAITTIAFQNFTANETGKAIGASDSLTNALSAALKSAEADTTAKQIALNVEPTQIEKSALKKHKKPEVIIGSDAALTENNANWVPKETEAAPEMNDSIGDELHGPAED